MEKIKNFMKSISIGSYMMLAGVIFVFIYTINNTSVKQNYLHWLGFLGLLSVAIYYTLTHRKKSV